MTIPSSRSLIFEVKSTGSELAFGRLWTSSEDFGRLRKTSDFFGRLRTSSGMFRNDRVVFKNASTPRIKISRLYLRKKLAGIEIRTIIQSSSNNSTWISIYMYFFQLQDPQKPHSSWAVIKLMLSDGKLKSIKKYN